MIKLSVNIIGLCICLLVALVIPSCTGDNNSNNETLVTIRGQVDDGTVMSPIADASCRVADRRGNQLAVAIANRDGAFDLGVPPEVEGWLECNPAGFPNLILSTFVSTVGIAAGETIPELGRDEVSPRTSMIANIIAQTDPPDPRARKAELLAALAAQDADLTRLAEAATVLFNALRQQPSINVDFSDVSGESGAEGGPGDSNGGIGGDAGDGAEFSPLVNVQCEFVLEPRGDNALEDLLQDGVLQRPDLQAIAAAVAQDPEIKDAYARLLPHGIQRLVNGQPLRTSTDDNGTYFLPVPPDTAGFVRCGPTQNLAVFTFVAPRQADETRRDEHVSPASQVFAGLIFPLLAPQDGPAVEANFLSDIGDLQRPTDGIVRVETMATPSGRIVADEDGDGLVCSVLEGVQDAAIQYLAAAGTVFTSTALFKAILIEARNPAVASYVDILARLLTRVTETNSPLVEVREEDLVDGGVPGDRAAVLTPQLNECIRVGVEEVIGVTRARMVRAGRLRANVRQADGATVPQALVTVEGAFMAAGSVCPDVVERGDNRLVCRANDAGTVTFVLLGETSLDTTPVTVTATSEDGALQGQLQTFFAPPATIDRTVLVTSQ